MIKYNLTCKKCNNLFDSWFPSSKEYEKLKNLKHINCPNCNSLKIEKSLMSPNVLNSKKKKSGVKEQLEKDNSGPGTDDQQQKQIDSKQKKADQIKKQVLLKKLQAVRQGGGSEIMASYSWRDDKNMRINKILNS